jgi:hypothetical protein
MNAPDDLQSWLDKNALGELVAALSSAVDLQGVRCRVRGIHVCSTHDRAPPRRVVPDRTMAGDDIANYWPARRGLDDPRYDRMRWPGGQGDSRRT